jgi:hypothetical protein
MFPIPAPGPRPKPVGARPFAVTGATVALVGAGKGGAGKDGAVVDYAITVSTNGPNPVTLTYRYAGGSGAAPVSRTVVLSGQTEYAVTGAISARPYCGGNLAMHISTSPAAGNGSVAAAMTPNC